MRANPLLSIQAFGQSVWIDFLSRDLLKSGQFSKMVLAGEISGVTTNPSIFDKAISSSRAYDEQIGTLHDLGYDTAGIARELMIADVIEAADILQSTFRRSDGIDGLVSVEVSPHLAYDADVTLHDARSLWHDIDRPNLLIKVPATRECLPVIRQLVFEGINVNATLLFDERRYLDVTDAYINALQDRAAAGLPLDSVISVASLFVSRIDSMVDTLLNEFARKSAGTLQRNVGTLTGKAAIARARLVYDRYARVFSDSRFLRMTEKGAHKQRIVWASTSTKNPVYSDIMYIESLVGAETITTMPVETLAAYRDHGAPELALPGDLPAAQDVLTGIEALGINMQEVSARLEREGVQKFCAAYDDLLHTLESRYARPAQATFAHRDNAPERHAGRS